MRNRIMKKQLLVCLICLVVAAAMCLAVSLTADPPPAPTVSPNGDSSTPSANSTSPSHTGSTGSPTSYTVRMYVCGREDAAAYRALALQYTKWAGIPCEILTGDLAVLMESDTPPTVFCLHSQADAQQWQNHLYDLSDTTILEQLYDPGFALSMDGKPVALAVDVTAYGIVYNAALLARVGYTRDDITDLSSLRQKVEAVTAEGKGQGFSAFCTPDFTSTQFTALLAGSSEDPDHIRALLDLISQNDTAGTNALESFTAGKTVFYIGGAWEYEAFSQLGFNNLDILPFYTDDSGSWPCICSHYWSVNSLADREEIAISLDFLYWLVTAGTNGTVPVDTLGYFAPFAQATAGDDVFMRLLLRKHLAAEPVAVSWSIAGGMTQNDLSDLSLALEGYMAAPSDETWSAVAELLP